MAMCDYLACAKCAKTHRIVIVDNPTVTPLADFLPLQLQNSI